MLQKALEEAKIAEDLLTQAARQKAGAYLHTDIERGLLIDAANVHAQLSTTAALLHIAEQPKTSYEQWLEIIQKTHRP